MALLFSSLAIRRGSVLRECKVHPVQVCTSRKQYADLQERHPNVSRPFQNKFFFAFQSFRWVLFR